MVMAVWLCVAIRAMQNEVCIANGLTACNDGYASRSGLSFVFCLHMSAGCHIHVVLF